MPYENPYIKKCKTHPHIILDKNEYTKYKWKWSEYFWNTNPLVIEIGSGMGNYFSYMVWNNRDANHIALELRYKRLYTTARKALEVCQSCTPHPPLAPSAAKRRPWLEDTCIHWVNFVVLQWYGQWISEICNAGEASEIYIYFPDPFCNKPKQLKHRLFTADFLRQVYGVLKAGWRLHFKTDHQWYFSDTRMLIEQFSWLDIVYETDDYKNSEIYNPDAITEFEGMFRGEQEDFYYMIVEKV